jgi:hypothetical protein
MTYLQLKIKHQALQMGRKIYLYKQTKISKSVDNFTKTRHRICKNKMKNYKILLQNIIMIINEMILYLKGYLEDIYMYRIDIR